MKEDNQILECYFEFKCPRQWESLVKLNDPEKRYCPTCEEEVFFVTNTKELEIYRKLGRCIAANVYSREFQMGITIAGGALPYDASVINVFGDKENASEVAVALERLQRKRQQINKSKE